jgi:hypothetical protein
MPLIQVDRDLFRRLVDRYYKLEIEHRGFRAMFDAAKANNLALSNEMEATYQRITDSLRNDWIELDSELGDAWAIEDDDAFLRVLSQFLSDRESGQ